MEVIQLSMDSMLLNKELVIKKSIKDIWDNYKLNLKNLTTSEMLNIIKSNKCNSEEAVNAFKPYEEVKKALEYFIFREIDDLQEEGSMAIELCEEEDSYHIISYWIDGTYRNIEGFLNDNYCEELSDIILKKYPYDLEVLKSKIIKVYGHCNNNLVLLEGLATILLQEYQHITEWYCIYGTEEEDMIDFKKYSINNAITDKDNFPIIKQEDVVAAMYGINTTVQPSDLYNVFAYYADGLEFKNERNLISENEELTFTPDPFLVAGVEARLKNYVDLINSTKKNSCCIDYVLTFNSINNIENYDLRNMVIMLAAVNDYINRFSETPSSLPILKDMVKAEYKGSFYEIKYSIRGVRNKNTDWDDILIAKYDIPVTPSDYQNLIYSMALDFKRELNGIQKKANGLETAYYGKYPNKDSATHGLKFIKDLNVYKKDRRGLKEKKKPMPNFNLALAEKQSTYLIKKVLRYARKNPILSTSFGVDSTITQHLIRRVAKHSYNMLHNNSRVEYPDLYKFRQRLIKEWNLENKITITTPIKSYWELQKINGWNWDRKGDRRNGVSASEQCCYYIKHLPTYKFLDKLIEEGNPMEVNFTGLKGCESRQRSQQTLRDNVIYYAKSWKSLKVSPIAFYTDEMTWEYVKKYDVPYCEVYDKVVYYEDVFDNVSEEEYGKVIYRPRVGCYPCSVSSTNSYNLYHMRKFFPKLFNHMMIDKGMAKDLFIKVAKKEGILPAEHISNETKKDSNQLSFFDSNDNILAKNTVKKLTSEDILNNYSLESMSYMIMRRPCKLIG